MRISVDKDDPGYRDWLLGSRARIWLDGIEITHVITADEEAREVTRYATNESGLMYPNEAKDGAQRETLRGTVRVELPPMVQQWIEQGVAKQPAQGIRALIDTRVI